MIKTIGNLLNKKYVERYLILLVALFIAAVNFNLFLNPLKIVTGGLNGLTIMFEHIFSINPSWFMLIFSVITLVIGYFAIGIEKTAGALVATFMYPFFVKLTASIGSIIVINTNDMLIISIISGVITGIVSGMIVRAHLSQGGVLLISQSISKGLNISVSRINFFINAVVVIIGGFFFGFYNAMYAIIILYISSIVMNRIILGVSRSKFLYIMTAEADLVKNYIMYELKYGITEFDGISGNSGDKKKFLMTVVPTKDYLKVTRYVKKVDSSAFFVVTDSYQTSAV